MGDGSDESCVTPCERGNGRVRRRVRTRGRLKGKVWGRGRRNVRGGVRIGVTRRAKIVNELRQARAKKVKTL